MGSRFVFHDMTEMTRRFLLSALPAWSLLKAGQNPIPDTPAGLVLKRWLDAMNSGNKETIAGYVKLHEPQGDSSHVEMLVGLAAEHGGFDLTGIESSKRTEIVALLAGKKQGRKLRFQMEVEDTTPPVVAGANLQPVEGPAPGPRPERTSLEGAVRAAVEFAGAEAAADRFSGALLVAAGGRVVVEKAWGLADREARTPCTPVTRFRIGSMNKMFTATAALQLVQKGRLALGDPLAKHLPEYPNRELAGKVTVRHLLTHTGGTGDIFGPEFEKNRLALREHADYLKLYGERPARSHPGERWASSNYGFVLLGALIEKVSGMNYYEYVRRNVYLPAGMTWTDSRPEAESVEGRSKGYLRGPGGWADNRDTLPARGTAAGGGYSTVGDLYRFALGLREGTLLQRALVDEATKTQEAAGRPGLGYGYGFMVDERAPRFFGHGGGAPGMNGELRIFPSSGVVVAALSNLDPPAATGVVRHFTDRMPAG
jgi:CubicO group peptidase (beta-lactamase class C family)